MVFRHFTRPVSAPLTVKEPVRDENGVLSVHHIARETRGPTEAAIRAMAQNAYMGQGLSLCRVLGRYKFFVDTHDFGLAPHLMLDGFWEMWVTEAIVSMVRPGMVVADIGANLGYFSMLMADLVGPQGRVHAFEPNPRLRDLLGRNVSINGFWPTVDLHPTALGDEAECEVALVIPVGEPKNAYTLADGQIAPPDALRGEEVRVACTRLDHRAEWREIEFAKIDVEGAEEFVWAGMQGLLNGGRLKSVLLEFCPKRYSDPAGFLTKLLAPGFTLARVDPWAGILDMTQAEVLASNPEEDIMLMLRR
ncbi:FkbM family methyltransferase [Novosphingobium sediminicola]|uniref:FkbM family methyltransferase n=1 Tax=Novosphingobium sediminicola TaxID=563162 RepID=A0A7W6GA74_9SPHN|nr:FkbM family methyltransferase [Novosphingobium sediminicola]MBB3957837.1 FkbM family methyltransferase [Novosphingobium sediminicola]